MTTRDDDQYKSGSSRPASAIVGYSDREQAYQAPGRGVCQEKNVTLSFLGGLCVFPPPPIIGYVCVGHCH